MTLSQIVNSPLLYALVAGGIAIVFAICAFFFVRARKRVLELGIDKKEFNAAMRAVSSSPSSPPSPSSSACSPWPLCWALPGPGSACPWSVPWVMS